MSKWILDCKPYEALLWYIKYVLFETGTRKVSKPQEAFVTKWLHAVFGV